tara:strand:- start:109 stop:801 length:693 start_codon:yes stop_codon:yes gene_type:complete
MKKLKDILSEAFEDTPKVDRHQVVEGVRNFGIVGKSLYNNNNIMEIAKQLSDIAESAHSHILGEQDDWFDKISVNKNMKTLKGSVVEFQKAAKEAHTLNQRMTALYEDIGHVLNRYYEIDEAHMYGHDDEDSEMEEKLDPVGKEDGDVDNDGDTDSSDEYLKKRRDAIAKAMKKEDKGDMDKDGKDEPDSEEYLQLKDKAIKKAMKKENTSLGGVVDMSAIRLGDLIGKK